MVSFGSLPISFVTMIPRPSLLSQSRTASVTNYFPTVIVSFSWNNFLFLDILPQTISSKRKMFRDDPTMTVENYFVTDDVLDWAGNEGLGIIGTNWRNRLPKDIVPFYLHK